MSQHRSTKIVPMAGLALAVAAALLLPAAPAQASEVVKLARLVITGKRLSAEPARPALLPEAATVAPAQTLSPQPVPQPLPRTGLLEGRQGEEKPQLLAQRRAAFGPL